MHVVLLNIDLALFIEKLVLIIIVVMASLGIAMYTTFAERKVAAILQDRRGPTVQALLAYYNRLPTA